MERNRNNNLFLIDKYLRRNNTLFTRLLESLNSKKGEEYLNSWVRRALDLTIAVPAAIVSSPLITVLGIVKKLEDGGPVFFIQERMDRKTMQDSIKLIKIRCMHENSDRKAGNIAITSNLAPEDDPRNTKVGKFMRKFQLEELPQLFQVIIGELSLIGIRVSPSYSLDCLKEKWSKDRYEQFLELYKLSGASLVDVASVFGADFIKGEEDKRYHTYAFYTKNANIGLDLYLLWRTFLKLTRLSAKLKQ